MTERLAGLQVWTEEGGQTIRNGPVSQKHPKLAPITPEQTELPMSLLNFLQ